MTITTEAGSFSAKRNFGCGGAALFAADDDAQTVGGQRERLQHRWGCAGGDRLADIESAAGAIDPEHVAPALKADILDTVDRLPALSGLVDRTGGRLRCLQGDHRLRSPTGVEVVLVGLPPVCASSSAANSAAPPQPSFASR